MSNIRNMIDAIANENFGEAKSALNASLVELMVSKSDTSNRDISGSGDEAKEEQNLISDEETIKTGE